MSSDERDENFQKKHFKQQQKYIKLMFAFHLHFFFFKHQLVTTQGYDSGKKTFLEGVIITKEI